MYKPLEKRFILLAAGVEPLELSTPTFQATNQPTQEEIDKAHNIFMKAVMTLFNEHKERVWVCTQTTECVLNKIV